MSRCILTATNVAAKHIATAKDGPTVEDVPAIEHITKFKNMALNLLCQQVS
jgi:hypothetical protein